MNSFIDPKYWTCTHVISAFLSWMQTSLYANLETPWWEGKFGAVPNSLVLVLLARARSGEQCVVSLEPVDCIGRREVLGAERKGSGLCGCGIRIVCRNSSRWAVHVFVHASSPPYQQHCTSTRIPLAGRSLFANSHCVHSSRTARNAVLGVIIIQWYQILTFYLIIIKLLLVGIFIREVVERWVISIIELAAWQLGTECTCQIALWQIVAAFLPMFKDADNIDKNSRIIEVKVIRLLADCVSTNYEGLA